MIDDLFDNNDLDKPKKRNSFLDGFFDDLEEFDKQSDEEGTDDFFNDIIIDEPEEEPIVPIEPIVEDQQNDKVIEEENFIDFLDDWFDSEDTNDKADDDQDEEDEIERTANEVQGDVLNVSNEKPKPLFPFKQDKRKAGLDITKNSKEDHRHPKRFTKRELQDQLKNDYRYMLGKKQMVVRPLVVLDEYPYKKKKSDSDIIDDDNVEYDYALVIGKLLKWKNNEQFRKKPYKAGEIMYVKRGVYWVDGKEVIMKPHFAIKFHKSYKRIKSKRIRDLLAPLKQRLRPGKPFTIYKEFPILIERTATFS